MFTNSGRRTVVAGLLSVAMATGATAQTDGRDGGHRAASGHDASQQVRGAPGHAFRYPAIGHEVRSLPREHSVVRVGRERFLYHHGVFYRPGRNGAYVVVRPPVGARVAYLPPGYISFGYGPRRYFYYGATYYLWDAPRREYVVVEPPENAPAAVAEAAEASGELFIYPRQGQSEEQRERDRYECYLWASDQSGFDPGSDEPDQDGQRDYRRALSACLEGRGYTVK